MPATIFEFGEFTLDSGRFELCRHGRVIALERKPLDLLILLAERNGQLVTRAEIAERLWEREVYVDTCTGSIRRFGRFARSCATTPIIPAMCKP